MNSRVKSNDGNHSRTKDKIATVVLIIETIILVIVVATFVSSLKELSYRGNRVVSATSMARLIQAESYPNIVTTTRDNRMAGVTEETNPEYTEVYAVADYYEAAQMINVYKNKGNTQKADEMQKKMEECRSKMKTVEAIADDIDKIFGVE